MPEVPIREEVRAPTLVLDVQLEEEKEDESPSNSVGGEDETRSEEEEESMEDVAATNPMEGLENLGAPTTEVEGGAALDAVTVEAEAMVAMMIEDNVEVLTIKSSPEWRGTLIEEETEMVEERENAETGNIPSTSTTRLETHIPLRKRRNTTISTSEEKENEVSHSS